MENNKNIGMFEIIGEVQEVPFKTQEHVKFILFCNFSANTNVMFCSEYIWCILDYYELITRHYSKFSV